jgi:hypothetical protein
MAPPRKPNAKQRRQTYMSWRHMVERCTDPRRPEYHYYGGRGITVCGRWLASFDAFIEDMGLRPAGLTLDRINNDAGYEPTNCRWATRQQQTDNSRRPNLLTVGDRTLSVAAWARLLGCSPSALWARLRLGWSVERALTELPRKKASRRFVFVDGLSLRAAAKSHGISYHAVRGRIRRGWSVTEALSGRTA